MAILPLEEFKATPAYAGAIDDTAGTATEKRIGLLDGWYSEADGYSAADGEKGPNGENLRELDRAALAQQQAHDREQLLVEDFWSKVKASTPPELHTPENFKKIGALLEERSQSSKNGADPTKLFGFQVKNFSDEDINAMPLQAKAGNHPGILPSQWDTVNTKLANNPDWNSPTSMLTMGDAEAKLVPADKASPEHVMNDKIFAKQYAGAIKARQALTDQQMVHYDTRNWTPQFTNDGDTLFEFKRKETPLNENTYQVNMYSYDGDGKKTSQVVDVPFGEKPPTRAQLTDGITNALHQNESFYSDSTGPAFSPTSRSQLDVAIGKQGETSVWRGIKAGVLAAPNSLIGAVGHGVTDEEDLKGLQEDGAHWGDLGFLSALHPDSDKAGLLDVLGGALIKQSEASSENLSYRSTKDMKEAGGTPFDYTMGQGKGLSPAPYHDKIQTAENVGRGAAELAMLFIPGALFKGAGEAAAAVDAGGLAMKSAQAAGLGPLAGIVPAVRMAKLLVSNPTMAYLTVSTAAHAAGAAHLVMKDLTDQGYPEKEAAARSTEFGAVYGTIMTAINLASGKLITENGMASELIRKGLTNRLIKISGDQAAKVATGGSKLAQGFVNFAAAAPGDVALATGAGLINRTSEVLLRELAMSQSPNGEKDWGAAGKALADAFPGILGEVATTDLAFGLAGAGVGGNLHPRGIGKPGPRPEPTDEAYTGVDGASRYKILQGSNGTHAIQMPEGWAARFHDPEAAESFRDETIMLEDLHGQIYDIAENGATTRKEGITQVQEREYLKAATKYQEQVDFLKLQNSTTVSDQGILSSDTMMGAVNEARDLASRHLTPDGRSIEQRKADWVEERTTKEAEAAAIWSTERQNFIENVTTERTEVNPKRQSLIDAQNQLTEDIAKMADGSPEKIEAQQKWTEITDEIKKQTDNVVKGRDPKDAEVLADEWIAKQKEAYKASIRDKAQAEADRLFTPDTPGVEPGQERVRSLTGKPMIDELVGKNFSVDQQHWTYPDGSTRMTYELRLKHPEAPEVTGNEPATPNPNLEQAAKALEGTPATDTISPDAPAKKSAPVKGPDFPNLKSMITGKKPAASARRAAEESVRKAMEENLNPKTAEAPTTTPKTPKGSEPTENAPPSKTASQEPKPAPPETPAKQVITDALQEHGMTPEQADHIVEQNLRNPEPVKQAAEEALSQGAAKPLADSVLEGLPPEARAAWTPEEINIVHNYEQTGDPALLRDLPLPKQRAVARTEADMEKSQSPDATAPAEDTGATKTNKGLTFKKKGRGSQGGSTIIFDELAAHIISGIKKGWNAAKIIAEGVARWGKEHEPAIRASTIEMTSKMATEQRGPSKARSANNPILQDLMESNKRSRHISEGQKKINADLLHEAGHLAQRGILSSKQFKDAQTSIKEGFGGGQIHGLDKVLSNVISELERIHPALGTMMRHFEFDHGMRQAIYNDAMEGIHKDLTFIKKKKLTNAEGVSLDEAFLTAHRTKNKAAIDAILATKPGMAENYERAKAMLKQIRQDAIDSGMEVGYHEDYWPSEVEAKQFENFSAFLLNEDQATWDVWQRGIERLEAQKSHVGTATPAEQMSVLNEILAKKPRGEAKIANTKGRKIENWLPEYAKFYRSNADSLQSYTQRMARQISENRFFGRDAETAQRMQNIEEADYDGFAGSSMGEEIARLKASGKLPDKAINKIQAIIKSRLAYKPDPKWFRNIKQGNVYFALNSPIKAVGQLTELAWTAKRHGFFNMGVGLFEATLNPLTGSAEAAGGHGLKALGIESGGQITGSRDPISGGANLVWTGSLYKFLDGVSARANSVALFRKLSNMSHEGITDYLAEYQRIWKRPIEEVAHEIKAGKFDSIEAKEVAWHELSNNRPVCLSNLPRTYLDASPVGRAFYNLRLFQIHQLDAIRNVFWKAASGEGNGTLQGAASWKKTMSSPSVVKGIASLAHTGALLMAAGMTTSQIKDWMLGRKTNYSSQALDEFLKIFGASKYQLDQADSPGPFDLKKIFNMAPVAAQVASDMLNLWKEGRDKRAIGEEITMQDIMTSKAGQDAPTFGIGQWWYNQMSDARGEVKLKRAKSGYSRDVNKAQERWTALNGLDNKDRTSRGFDAEFEKLDDWHKARKHYESMAEYYMLTNEPVAWAWSDKVNLMFERPDEWASEKNHIWKEANSTYKKPGYKKPK